MRLIGALTMRLVSRDEAVNCTGRELAEPLKGSALRWLAGEEGFQSGKHGSAGQVPKMKIRHGKRHAVGADKKIGVLKKRYVERNEH